MKKTGLAARRLMALSLAALMACGLVGCDAMGFLPSSDAVETAAPPAVPAAGAEDALADEAPDALASSAGEMLEGGEPAAPTPLPDVTSVPTAAPSPVPVVEIADYKYQKLNNKTLDVSFTYPSHWINKPGSITISYVQPVDADAVAARVAVSVKKVSKDQDANALKDQLEKLIDSVSGEFADFRRGSASKKIKFLGGTAYSVVYEASLSDQPVKGFIIVTYKKGKKRLVALHFYAPADQYDDFAPVLKQIQGSVKLT